MLAPCRQRPVISYSTHLATSFTHWTGQALTEASAPDILAENLYRAPFALISHGTQRDPLFRYANLTAQLLWNKPWAEFIKMPSRLSAEADAREERERLLKKAAEQGYVEDYQGIRITSDGKRFRIGGCILWSVLDAKQKKIGQAAMFRQWEWL